MAVLIAILVFGALILIHEFGHYLTARIFHVEIHEFSIGMGPKLLSYRSKKTGIRYSIRLLPFGGYVSMPGELGEDPEERPRFGFEAVPPLVEEKQENEDDGYTIANRGNTLASRKPAERLVVHAAGATMNLVLGIILLFALCLSLAYGSSQHSLLGTTTVSGIFPADDGSSSADFGLRVGDKILSVAGQRVFISDQLMYQIMRYGYTGEAVEVKVRHADGTRETLRIIFPVEEIEGQRFGSFDFTVLPEERSFSSVLRHVFFRSCYIVEMIWESIFDLFSGRYTIDAVAGPLGTAGAITEAAKTGLNSLLYITIVITINLGVFNLLPIPPLDGGHIVYTLYEMIFRRPIPQKISVALDSAFTLLFFGFLIFITIKDLVGFF